MKNIIFPIYRTKKMYPQKRSQPRMPYCSGVNGRPAATMEFIYTTSLILGDLVLGLTPLYMHTGKKIDNLILHPETCDIFSEVSCDFK